MAMSKPIPDDMPYTYQDVIDCKILSLDKIKKNYDTLCKYKALTNAKKTCGNPILYHYQFENLLNCRREGKPLLKELFDDEEEKQKLWKATVKLNRNDKHPYPKAVDVYECNRVNQSPVVFFKPATAKYIYTKYNATCVLDFTAGWGGRMLGASSMDIHYFGFDTNIKLKDGYDKMMEDLYICSGFVEENEDTGSVKDIVRSMNYQSMLKTKDIDNILKYIEYDCILTSPPYVNLEQYEGMPLFESIAQYFKEFLIPSLDLSFKHLKVGGVMCINISQKIYDKLTNDFGYRKCDEEVDLRQGENFATKTTDICFVWKKVKEVKPVLSIHFDYLEDLNTLLDYDYPFLSNIKNWIKKRNNIKYIMKAHIENLKYSKLIWLNISQYWYEKYFDKKKEYDALVKENEILKSKLSNIKNIL
tara:strand:- start:483 stop:1733 length:1251 start_codon:yes stop_codon:yes gene_type:complete